MSNAPRLIFNDLKVFKGYGLLSFSLNMVCFYHTVTIAHGKLVGTNLLGCLTNWLGCDAVIYASPVVQLYGLILIGQCACNIAEHQCVS